MRENRMSGCCLRRRAPAAGQDSERAPVVGGCETRQLDGAISSVRLCLLLLRCACARTIDGQAHASDHWCRVRVTAAVAGRPPMEMQVQAPAHAIGARSDSATRAGIQAWVRGAGRRLRGWGCVPSC